MNRNTIICRCEDVTLQDLEPLLEEGYETIEEIKRMSRCGMGPCQGRTCINSLIDLMARYQGCPPSAIEVPTFRPPTKPVHLGMIAASSAENGDQ